VKFLVEHGTEDESSKESDGLPDYEESLGTNPSFPGQNIEGTLAGNAQCTEDVPTQNIARNSEFTDQFTGNVLSGTHAQYI